MTTDSTEPTTINADTSRDPSAKKKWVQFTFASILFVGGLAAVAVGLITGNIPMVIAGAVSTVVGYGWFVVKELANPLDVLIGIFYVWP